MRSLDIDVSWREQARTLWFKKNSDRFLDKAPPISAARRRRGEVRRRIEELAENRKTEYYLSF